MEGKVGKFSLSDKQNPHENVLVNFTNGHVVCDAGPDSLKFAYHEFVKTDTRSNLKRTLVCESECLTYIGHNTGILAPRGPIYSKHHLCVFNSKTGKMRILSEKPACIFNMRPVNQDESSEEDEQESIELTFRQKVDKLTSAFGSKKKKQNLASKAKHVISKDSLETVVGSAVSHTLTQFKEGDLDDGKIDKPQAAEVIPPHNVDATRPQDAYLLKDIISNTEMAVLGAPAEVLINSTRETIEEWAKVGKYSTYVLNRLRVLPISEAARHHTSCCLAYLSIMIKFYNMTAKELTRRFIFPSEVPQEVADALLTRFTESHIYKDDRKTRYRSARDKDRLLSYILVLCLILEDFNLHYTALHQDLKLGQNKLNEHLRALGCKLTKSRVTNPDGTTSYKFEATLPMPLTFPMKRQKDQKKKRR